MFSLFKKKILKRGKNVVFVLEIFGNVCSFVALTFDNFFFDFFLSRVRIRSSLVFIAHLTKGSLSL